MNLLHSRWLKELACFDTLIPYFLWVFGVKLFAIEFDNKMMKWSRMTCPRLHDPSAGVQVSTLCYFFFWNFSFLWTLKRGLRSFGSSSKAVASIYKLGRDWKDDANALHQSERTQLVLVFGGYHVLIEAQFWMKGILELKNLSKSHPALCSDRSAPDAVPFSFFSRSVRWDRMPSSAFQCASNYEWGFLFTLFRLAA